MFVCSTDGGSFLGVEKPKSGRSRQASSRASSRKKLLANSRPFTPQHTNISADSHTSADRSVHQYIRRLSHVRRQVGTTKSRIHKSNNAQTWISTGTAVYDMPLSSLSFSSSSRKNLNTMWLTAPNPDLGNVFLYWCKKAFQFVYAETTVFDLLHFIFFLPDSHCSDSCVRYTGCWKRWTSIRIKPWLPSQPPGISGTYLFSNTLWFIYTGSKRTRKRKKILWSLPCK